MGRVHLYSTDPSLHSFLRQGLFLIKNNLIANFLTTDLFEAVTGYDRGAIPIK